jgi:hypothetical protein
MKLTRLSGPLFVCTSLIPLHGRAQTVQPQRPPAHTQKSQGMFGYALSRVNPNDHDYGNALASGRESVVEHTIDDAYFWSNCVTLALLGGLGIWVILLNRSKNKMEIIVSHLIAQLWNGRISDRIEIDRRTHLYNEIVEQQNEAAEKLLSERRLYKKKNTGRGTSNTLAKEDEQQPTGEISTVSLPQPAEVIVQHSVEAQVEAPAALPSHANNSSESTPNVSSQPDSETERLKKELTTSQQESRLLTGQVQALKHREANLVVRLNQMTELHKQASSREQSGNQ